MHITNLAAMAVAPASRRRWMIPLRRASRRQPTFVFFPHAGGSVLSAGRLVAALPPSVGVMVANLPRGGDLDGDCPPRRVAVAVTGAMEGFLSVAEADNRHDPLRPVLVGNSYGALVAYEMARSLIRAGLPVERLIVSGFRAPTLASVDAALHRLPSEQLWAELTARFRGMPATDPVAVEDALRADLEACDTYRHSHAERLALPVDVLHMVDDPSVSVGDLLAWQSVTSATTQVIRHAGGHFPWATHPDAMAGTLLHLVDHRLAAEHA